MRERSIRRHFTGLILFSIAALVVVQACIVFAVYQGNRRMSQQYVEENVQSAAVNVERYLSQIENMAYHISTNWSLISLYSGESFMNADNAFENASQMVQFMCGYETSIAGIVVLRPDGSGTNFFGMATPGMIEAVQPEDFYSNTNDLDRKFCFFDAANRDFGSFFVYYAPVFDRDAAAHMPVQKVATALFICNKRELERLLGNVQGGAATYSLTRASDGALIAGSRDAALPSADSRASAPLPGSGLAVHGASDSSVFAGSMGQILTYLSVLFAAVALILVLLHHSLRKYVTLPFDDLHYQLSHFDSGDLKGRIRPTGIGEIDYFVQSTNKMIGDISSITRKVFYTQDKLYESELRKTEAELYALQSQINPHFLYNTLQCIRGLAAMGRCGEIKEITLAMADVFHYSIQPGEFVRILDEIKSIYQYLAIYRIRFDSALDYDIDVPEELLDCRTIKMIIQPTVENAMMHAFQDTDVRPKIHIFALESDGGILIRVIDNGSGIDYATLQTINHQLEKPFSDSIKETVHVGQGLYNINRRIKLTYGDGYGITIHSNPNGTEVDILIPRQEYGENEPDAEM